MNELALFAGAGGGILGGHLLGWRTVCAVEWEPYAASILAARQNDGLLPPFPIWDDVRTFDGRPWRGIVNVVSGGFPCQDISVAGKGDGLDGERSGLWSEMARIIGEVRPRFAWVENSPALTSRGLGRVLGDLAAMGYDCQWGVISAADAGAPHLRERIWIMADANSVRESQQERSQRYQRGWTGNGSEAARSYASSQHAQGKLAWDIGQEEWPVTRNGSFGSLRPDGGWWAAEPRMGRMAHGVAARSNRLKALGNGQVPQCAALAWRILSGK
jgi:DNA (cytosine-5)-methyltransferase 1